MQDSMVILIFWYNVLVGKTKKPGEPGCSLKTTSAYSLVVIRCCGYDTVYVVEKSIAKKGKIYE